MDEREGNDLISWARVDSLSQGDDSYYSTSRNPIDLHPQSIHCVGRSQPANDNVTVAACGAENGLVSQNREAFEWVLARNLRNPTRWRCDLWPRPKVGLQSFFQLACTLVKGSEMGPLAARNAGKTKVSGVRAVPRFRMRNPEAETEVSLR